MYNSLIKPMVAYRHMLRTTQPKLILQDVSIGIPLNIFSNIYTNLHYGFDITTPKLVLLEVLLGYYAYGYDRLKDANQFNNVKNNVTDISIYPSSKINLYEKILEQKGLYSISLHASLFAIIYFLLIDNYDITHVPFIFLLYISATYKEYKPYLSIYKPFFIATMWTITTVGLPCILHDNNYDILMYPQDYLPCLLFILSASNFADINDLEEDKKLGINTIPVVYGKEITSLISFIAVASAAILLIENPNFENRFWINSILEFQHLGLMWVIYNNTFLQELL